LTEDRKYKIDADRFVMAAGFASALLDELMGRNRDNDPADRIEAHWSDPNVSIYV